MRKIDRTLCLMFLFASLAIQAVAQQAVNAIPAKSHILTSAQLEELFKRPQPLEQYRTNQSGPLHRIGSKEGQPDDSTFTVETLDVPSDGLLIHGWLYLPLGNGKAPLIVLTNGGGDDSRPIKSLSDWIAPILAHCGFAAFVHDKRGTGKSGGTFVETTYDDYVTDAGNCALFLSKHKRINPEIIGVLGGSEGGRIAVLAASRFPIIKFVISFAGTVVSTEEDRIYAQMGGLKSEGISDSVLQAVRPLWMRSFAAWASNNPARHEEVDKEILEWRKKFARDVLPATKQEIETSPELKAIVPTWRSMPNDYLTELGHFKKPWFAIFGEVDQTVPTHASIKNILHHMSISGNQEYTIAVIPTCGHSPVDIETRRMVRLDNLIINWLNEHVTSSRD